MKKYHQYLSHSINTICVLSFIFEGQVHILSAVFRMGAGGSRFDNASAGGLFCGDMTEQVLRYVFKYNERLRG